MRHREPGGSPEALPAAAGYRFAIVVSRFNHAITDALRSGARAALGDAGAGDADVEEFDVPGAYELPQAARAIAETGRFDAVICLGCVIRGDTDHYDHVASTAASGIAQVALDTGVPVLFGVLTCENLEQALQRAGGKAGNKGFDAALAAIEMVNLMRTLPLPEGPRS